MIAVKPRDLQQVNYHRAANDSKIRGARFIPRSSFIWKALS